MSALKIIQSTAFLAVVISSMAACTIIPKPEHVASYRLAPATIQTTNTDISARNIQVKRPQATDLFADDRVLRLQNDGSFNAYAGARWNNPIPILWRDWLIDSLWRDPRFQEISGDSGQVRSDFQLLGTVRSFHVEGQQAEIRFDAQVMRSSERRIIAERSFVVRHPMSGTGASAAATALSRAADNLNQELRDWLVQTVGAP
ncbi:hypothetical protein FM042_03275 [Aliidiomarina halalkaliphila]|uniref:ABC-type transport auxiliary lipoprotein component domain-containing protein n=1 Tax=Aliidiomarina halalkaliphila TaxID=2593535 RepID=A0A552X4D3_9GAMM|nr:ABC-type transport auxiliary lipoprotein family protein [Aliidiomarina halalkaliphila]TRW49887.1 hypothetical protein FM042_03275 [Aliidiomarina halalkaliphila]